MPRDRILVLASVSLFTLGVSNFPMLLAQAPAFRAGVDLVSLAVTVADGNRRYVTGLTRDDFAVMENGQPQHITFFARTGVPLAIAVLIDTSASMDQALPTAQEAAIGFVNHLGAEDVAAIIDFDSRVQIAQPFTRDVQSLQRAIRQTTAGGSTALYNAIYIALKELSRPMPEDDQHAPRRRAVIVLSDGDDTSSLVTFEDVLESAARSDVVIYTIGLGLRDLPAARARSDGPFVLRRLAQQTGGRAFFPQQARDLPAVYGDIRDELSSQYLLAYESNVERTGGEWRRIAVRVNRPGVSVRTRRGYFAPSGERLLPISTSEEINSRRFRWGTAPQ